MLKGITAALRTAATTFRRYAELHQAKGTPEGVEKAKANAALAEQMEAALDDLDGAGMKLALVELHAALDFFDRVKAAPERDRIAVGTDHWDRLEAATRGVVAKGQIT